MDMDILFYKRTVQAYSDEELIVQYKNYLNQVDICWDNAQDCTGNQKEYWLEEFHEANECTKILENELSYRNISI